MTEAEHETETRRRRIYIGERLKEAGAELDRIRAELEALRVAPDRNQRRYVYLTYRLKAVQEERISLAAELRPQLDAG